MHRVLRRPLLAVTLVAGAVALRWLWHKHLEPWYIDATAALSPYDHAGHLLLPVLAVGVGVGLYVGGVRHDP